MPSGMIANLLGPVEDKRHGCAILAMSALSQTLQSFSHGPHGEALWIFGDPISPKEESVSTI